LNGINIKQNFLGNEPYDEEQPSYVPFELVNRVSNNSNTIYYCYLIELKQNFSYDITVQDIFLATRVMLEPEIGCMQFDTCFDKGSLSIKLNYKGSITLSPDQVSLHHPLTVSGLFASVGKSQ
jgi:endoribonuclease Dicer